MKYSIYNNGIVLSPLYGLLYNAYTNMYVLLRINQYHIYFTHSSEQLKERFPQMYKQLLNAGCIIDDDIDEVELLHQRIEQVDSQKDNYILTVNPTMNCNFKCWYCYENHLQHSKMSLDTLGRTKKFITKTLSEHSWQKFHLGFFGGEPLLYYKDVVRPLIQHLIQKCTVYNTPYSIGFTSNGYLLSDEIIREMNTFKVSSLQITLDGGKNLHNKVRYPFIGGDSYTRIVTNIKKLLQTEISVILRINYTADNLSTITTIIDDFRILSNSEKKYLRVDFHRVWQDSENKDSVVDLKELENYMQSFEDNGIIVSPPIMDQVWNSCYADKEQQALINYNGDIYKCTARDFTKEKRLGILNEDGTITWDEEKMKRREGVRLSKEVCQHCRIAPICGGTCTQRGLDSGSSNQCIRGLNEAGKDKIVLNQFYYNIVKNEVSV